MLTISRARALLFDVEQYLHFWPRVLCYKAVLSVQLETMYALDNNYDIWSRLRPILLPGTLDTATQIKVGLRANVCQPLVQNSLLRLRVSLGSGYWV